MAAKKKLQAEDGEAYLEKAIARYSAEVAEIARAGLKKMRARYPGAGFVYYRRQSLPIGFAPAEGGAIFSMCCIRDGAVLLSGRRSA